MRTEVLMALLVVLPVAASAQQTPTVPKAVKTQRFPTSPAAGPATNDPIADGTPTVPKVIRTERLLASPAAARAMTAMAPDGTLLVDWDAVSEMAESQTDPQRALARMLLAVKSGAWRPMPKL